MTQLIPPIDPADLTIAPHDEAQTIPAAWYTQPAFHTWELEVIHARTWQLVGHVNRLPHPGDYLAVTVAQNPLVIVRDKAGELRAFYNVCRHRGGPLVTAESGCVRALQCQYHGWTYWLDGMLRGVPEFDFVKLFDKKEFGLVPVRLAVWQGLIFVTLSDETPPLDGMLAGIAERIAPLSLTPMQFHARQVYDVDCNWKVYIDNYLEGYHVPFVHPELNKLLDYRQYVTETAVHYSLQHSPMQAADGSLYGSGGEAFYYFIYPNSMLNILPGRLQSNLVLPLSHDRCRVIFDFYYTDVFGADQAAFIAEDLAYSDLIQQEDIDICQRVQQGLASRAYDKGRFSVTRELGVYHFQSLIKTSYRAAL